MARFAGKRTGKLLILLCVGLMLACCSRRQRDMSQYVRDSVQYGKTEGTFRGRWWSYYERGRSFADGGFYDEAEADLRVALQSRDRDQWWARTYGMHFLDDYFPHRELGIVYYKKGQLDEARDHLERSIEQEFSARAAHYLDRLRADLVARDNLDAEVPELVIMSPVADGVVGDYQIEVVGVARDDTFVKAIQVDGEDVLLRVSAPEHSFKHVVTLAPGQNRVTVHVEDIAGRTTTREIALLCDTDGPAVSFDGPVVLPGDVAGVVYDPRGVASFTLAGRPVSLEPGDDRMYSFKARVAREDLENGLAYETADSLGNITRGQVPVDTVRLASMPTGLMPASGPPVLMPLTGTVSAVMVGPHLLGLTRAAPLSTGVGPEVELRNLQDGFRFFQEAIQVQIQVTSLTPIAEVRLLNETLPVIPQRKRVQMSRKVQLDTGENIVNASARDVEGRTTESAAKVLREQQSIDKPQQLLSTTVIEESWKRRGPITEEAFKRSVDMFYRELDGRKRFNHVTRGDALGDILLEQEIVAQLASRGPDFVLQNLQGVELLLHGTVDFDGQVVTVIVECISVELGTVLAIVDEAGPLEDLDIVVSNVAELVVQEFPRPRGAIRQFSGGDTAFCDLKAQDRVKRSMKCLLYEYRDVMFDGEVVGQDTHVLRQGVIEEVRDRFSKARFAESGEDGGLPESLPQDKELWIVPK